MMLRVHTRASASVGTGGLLFVEGRECVAVQRTTQIHVATWQPLSTGRVGQLELDANMS